MPDKTEELEGAATDAKRAEINLKATMDAHKAAGRKNPSIPDGETIEQIEAGKVTSTPTTPDTKNK